MSEELSLEEENKFLRDLVEKSYQMVITFRGLALSPQAFGQKERKEVAELFMLYCSMLQKLGFNEKEIFAPED